MTVYAQHVSTRSTPQSQPIPGSTQVPNSAGGFAWAVDDWARLDRFLILGNEGGSYYASERKLTAENAQAVQRCIATDSGRAIGRIVEVSEGGRAPKNDPAIFALALCAAAPNPETRRAALDAMPRVCRIGTHVFQFSESVQQLRGWGRTLRRAVSNWYAKREPRELAYQVTKYQQRNGWSHRDLMRLCHFNRDTFNGRPAEYREIYNWVTKGWEGVGEDPHPNKALLPIWAMEKAKRAASKTEIVRLIREFDLVRECIPTNWLNEPEVWEALLEKMPLTAMVRNLGKMTAVGLTKPLSAAASLIVSRLGDDDWLRKSRVHPLAVLVALKTYQQGHGDKGKLTWSPVGQIVDALDRAFYAAFGNVESTGKRFMLSLDVSSSMGGGLIAGMPGITPRVGSAAMALITAATEPNFVANGFTTGLTPLSISPRQRLDDVIRTVSNLPFGGTDCSLPMVHALREVLPVDVFCVYTDSETWAGHIHPSQAIRAYREKTGIYAKLVVIGMVSNGFSIADPEDGGMMDVVGFDLATPGIISDFARRQPG